MPHLASSAKRLRQAKKITDRRKLTRSQIDSQERQIKKMIVAKDKTKALDLVKNISKSYDKAGTKGIMHRNKAARKKSRLMKKINQLA